MIDPQSEHPPMIHVVLAWVNQDGRPEVRSFEIVSGMTAAGLFRLSGVFAERMPLPVMGVFSLKIADPEQYVMQAGDRLELYQPLILSPMAVRRARARAHPVGRIKPKP